VRAVELPRRTVRYCIQQGLVDRPDGAGRGASYGTRHLAQLLEIRKWQQAGLSLERIRGLRADGSEARIPPRRREPGTVKVWSHIVLGEGLELNVEPPQAGLTPEQLRELVREVSALFDSIRHRENECHVRRSCVWLGLYVPLLQKWVEWSFDREGES
jgi:DNA-binding transcriptional MerR regulator